VCNSCVATRITDISSAWCSSWKAAKKKRPRCDNESGERTRLACWFESLAVASRPLQRRRAETVFRLDLTCTKRNGHKGKSAIARTRSPTRETRALPIRMTNAPCQFRVGSGQFASLLESTLRFVHFASQQSPPFQCLC